MIVRFIGVLPLVLCLTGVAAAQGSGGSVRGYVQDAQGAVLHGATVTASSPTVALPYSVASDDDGLYRLLDLPPAQYTITAELAGFSKFVRTNVVVRAGLNLTLDLVLAVGAISETVVVQANTPMIESATAVKAINISGEFQREVPVSARRLWSDVLSMTPGMVSIEGAPGGVPQYLLRGAGNAQQAIAIDGADVVPGQNATSANVNVSTEALADTQVKNGALDASSPMAFGAVVNMVTKSGTNTLRGVGSISYQAMGWNANNLTGGTAQGTSITQPDLSLGGPILKDRAWFFVAYRYQRRIAGITRTAAQIETLKSIYPAFEPFDGENFAHYPFIKGTARVGDRHRLSGFYQRDFTGNTDVGFPLDTQAFSKNVNGGPASAVFFSSAWNSSWLTRLSVTYNDKAANSYRSDNQPMRPVFQNAFVSGGRLTGNTQLATLDNTSFFGLRAPWWKYTVTGDATYYQRARGGSHEVKTGFYFQKLHNEARQQIVNDGFGREELVLRNAADPSAGTVPFHRTFWPNPDILTGLTDNYDTAFYLQDDWRPASRLTVNAGVRVDFVRRFDRLFDVKTQQSTEVGPRFGINYMLTADRRNALYASLARWHDVLQTGVASAGSNAGAIVDQYDNNLDGVFETEFVTPATTLLSTNTIFDVDRHQPHVNELSAGYRRQFPGQLSANVAYSRRYYGALSARVEVNGIYENNVFRGYRDVSQNAITLITNATDNSKVYDGLDVEVSKETRWLQLIASYGRQWRHESGTWQSNDPAAFIQPGAFANDKGIGQTQNAESNSLSGTSHTNIASWRDHVFRLAASYHAPWQLLVSTNYIVESGMWSGPIVTRIAAADPQFGPATVTLSNGRVVPNPLATVIRFAYPTRGEGQFTSPTVHWWNVRVGREFTAGRNRLEAAVDVFNVLNSAGDYQMGNGANQTFNAGFKTFQFRQPPRSAQIFLRYAF
jgi:hypothetical protein